MTVHQCSTARKTCERCGKNTYKGYVQCSACKDEISKENRNKEDITCIDCGTSINAKNRKRVHPLRCESCKTNRALLLSRNSNLRRRKPTTTAIRNCKICGKEFDAYLVVIKGKKRYSVCSEDCYVENDKRENIKSKHGYYSKELEKSSTRICRVCGNEFFSKHPRQCYCSRSCSRKNGNKLRRCRRHSNARDNAVSHELVDVGYIFERDKWKCGLCGKKVNKELRYPHPKSASLDHIVPLAEGGVHCKANVQIAHFDCNHRKGMKSKGEQLLLIG